MTDQSRLREAAQTPFSSGSSAADPFRSTREVDQQETPRGVASDAVDELVVETGGGDEDSFPYHQYVGTSLRKRATILAVRFATNTVLVRGERLRAYRDAIVRRRCEVLAPSSRMERISRQGDQGPVIESVHVTTPKKALELLGDVS